MFCWVCLKKLLFVFSDLSSFLIQCLCFLFCIFVSSSSAVLDSLSPLSHPPHSCSPRTAQTARAGNSNGEICLQFFGIESNKEIKTASCGSINETFCNCLTILPNSSFSFNSEKEKVPLSLIVAYIVPSFSFFSN